MTTKKEIVYKFVNFGIQASETCQDNDDDDDDDDEEEEEERKKFHFVPNPKLLPKLNERSLVC